MEMNIYFEEKPITIIYCSSVEVIQGNHATFCWKAGGRQYEVVVLDAEPKAL